MSQALELRESAHPVALTSDQLNFISRTEFVPAALRGNLPAILACVSTGRELGIGDMASLRSIHIVDGKATFSAELMVQLVRKAGHSITFKASGDSCTVYGKRADNGDEGEFEWTMQMAERAGLLAKKGDSWKKYPEAMLWARAVSQLCRMLFADCFVGGTYTPEELGADDVTADELMGEPIVLDVDLEYAELEGELLGLAERLNVRPTVEQAIADHQTQPEYGTWLSMQIRNAKTALDLREESEPEPVASRKAS